MLFHDTLVKLLKVFNLRTWMIVHEKLDDDDDDEVLRQKKRKKHDKECAAAIIKVYIWEEEYNMDKNEDLDCASFSFVTISMKLLSVACL